LPFVTIARDLEKAAIAMSLRFEWDGNKADSNLTLHGVSFDEASTVFNDPLAKIFDDLIHSVNEIREIIIGRSSTDRLLLVCFTERATDVIRIISAREPTRKERRGDEENTNF
jgi:uncharacterized protein